MMRARYCFAPLDVCLPYCMLRHTHATHVFNSHICCTAGAHELRVCCGHVACLLRACCRYGTRMLHRVSRVCVCVCVCCYIFMLHSVLQHFDFELMSLSDAEVHHPLWLRLPWINVALCCALLLRVGARRSVRRGRASGSSVWQRTTAWSTAPPPVAPDILACSL